MNLPHVVINMLHATYLSVLWKEMPKVQHILQCSHLGVPCVCQPGVSFETPLYLVSQAFRKTSIKCHCPAISFSRDSDNTPKCLTHTQLRLWSS